MWARLPRPVFWRRALWRKRTSRSRTTCPTRCSPAKELPTFKFELEKSKGKVIGGSYGKEATVKQLPISKGIAGVSMRLEPGVMRELHWHATAAEWAFVIEGRVRTTVIDPQGDSETNDFDPGDIWYFPRGHGHMLQCLGDKPCHFILIFDNGYFSEFGTFSITDWLGHAPKALLAKNFGLPESAFDEIPQGRGLLRPRARCRPPSSRRRTSGAAEVARPMTHKYRMLAAGAALDPQGRPRVAGRLGPVPDLQDDHRRRPRPGARRPARAALAPQRRRVAVRHLRPRSASRCSARTADTGSRRWTKGDVGYIPQGYGHSIENIGKEQGRMLIGFNTGHYEAIDLSQWIAGNPRDVLATNFGKPAESVR